MVFLKKVYENAMMIEFKHRPVRFLRILRLSYPNSFIGYPGGSFVIDSR